MDKDRPRLAGLYDCYGALLTDKQRAYFEERYLDDLSLAEIAENEGISKQGVRDLIIRTERTLEDFEAKLGFAELLRDASRGLDELGALIERREMESAAALVHKLKERLA